MVPHEHEWAEHERYYSEPATPIDHPLTTIVMRCKGCGDIRVHEIRGSIAATGSALPLQALRP